MGLLASLKSLFGKGKTTVENAGDQVNVENLKEKADTVLDKAEGITEKIPGQVDDKVVDAAQNLRDKLQ